jgi:hypothetical protein
MQKSEEGTGLLAEVFGFHIHDLSEEAKRHRRDRLCPFHNKVPNCTKDKAENPLGVCTILEKGKPIITCPVRFRQKWLITSVAAEFFFPPGAKWTSLSEVPLPDADGRTAGNLDFVLVSYDDHGRLTDFGAVEVQAVYISGNVRQAFERYMSGNGFPQAKARPDYLSSSRKRLVPQLLYKGYIFKEWGKKMAVVVQKPFFSTLPPLPSAESIEKADLAWLIFDLVPENVGEESIRYVLHHVGSTYTLFEPAMEQIVKPKPGPVDEFKQYLQERLNQNLSVSPEMRTLFDLELIG